MKIGKVLLPAGAAFLVSLALPATVPQASAAMAVQSDDEQTALNDLIDLIYRDPSLAISQINRAIPEMGRDKEAKSFMLALRGLANLIRGKDNSADADLAEASKLDPKSEMPALYRFLGGVEAENWQQAARGFDALIAISPERIKGLTPDLIYGYLREYKDPHGDDQRVALAKIGYGGADGQWLNQEAAKILMSRGRLPEAAALVGKIDDASIYQSMLVDRTFEPLWPSIEAQSGPGMTLVGKRGIDAAEKGVAAAPDDVKAKTRLIDAYANLRRYDEADRVGKAFAATPETLRAVDQDGGWLINAHAYALFGAGRKAEAKARFAKLIDARLSEAWIISMVINRLELVVRDGDFAEAQNLMPVAEREVATKGSPYAKQLVRRLAMCTAAGLGKSDEVVRRTADFMAHTADADDASVEGLMCIGKTAEAKALMLKLLADKDKRQDAVKSLQKSSMIATDPSKWDGYWAELRKDPEVEAAFQKVGRDLPPQFRVQ